MSMTAFESIMDFLDPEYHEDDDLLEKKVVTEAMKKSDRDKLPDSAFALPKKRKYPINDEESVRNGIKYFRFVPEEDRKECADNLYKAAKKFKIDITITAGNPFNKFYPDVKVVPPTRRDKANRVVPKKMYITDAQEKIKKQNESKKENDAVTEGIFQWGSRKKENNNSFEDKDLGQMTLNSYFSHGTWEVTIHGKMKIPYMGKMMPVDFSYQYGNRDKKEYDPELLKKLAVITDKARSNFRKVVKGWMRTPSCTAKLKELIREYEDYYEDANLKYPRTSEDFQRIHTPTKLELYPNGTLLLYVKNPVYENNAEAIVMLAPKVDSYDSEDTYPAKVAWSDSVPTIQEVEANYEKNKGFVKFSNQ